MTPQRDKAADGPAMMRAALIRRHGDAPEYDSHPVPRRQTGEALIRVTAAVINPLDQLCASGASYFGAPPLPYVPGVQGVGVVEAAHGVEAGQRVFFSSLAGIAPGDGSLAEYCVVPEQAVVPVPADVPDDLVAALGLSAVAAWMALTWRGGLRDGEHVLVLGASGTVGQVAVQAAKLLGAGRVVAACRDAHGRDRAAALGADAVADLTGDADEIFANLAAAIGGRLDLVLDPVWGAPAEAAMRCLSPGGRLVNLGSSAGATASFSSAGLRSAVLGVLGYTNAALTDEQRGEAFGQIMAHAAEGRLTADRQIFPLSQAAEAWSSTGKPPHRKPILVP